ncbi:type 1 glutamine amidotransferase domain-containing protein [Serratia sp. UGAL515B_01]|uniref:type 1 glutamine amidotransferase domain-containing protein n=1 Tax=Serratia sp. UGAL515B_01 TaxID=2986763 RepID=UPI0029550476|nr:type 1 glutamine amidotransferase domain-containing protein [Serratia sp. UGAL515B_01]WON78401.1 type 1 glutamine amidotransferase domain-containing protein [Serratia sp. UGAL515B_01]
MRLVKYVATLLLSIGISATTLAAEPHGRVLVLLSGENQLLLKDGKTYPTGYYLNEFGVPADSLLKAGYELVLVTPNGKAPSVDERSVDPLYFSGNRNEMLRTQSVVQNLPGISKPQVLAEVLAGDLTQYAGLLIPGGHAPLIDLANNPQVGELLKYFHTAGKPTAAICHGPITLLSAQDNPKAFEAGLIEGKQPQANNWIYQGYRMTIFADAEERVFENSLKGDKIRYYPAKAMATAGGKLEQAKAWTPNVVVDRELITGQNPFSDHALAKALLAQLQSAQQSIPEQNSRTDQQ